VRLTVVINTYENPVALDAVLARLCRARQLADELVVADDGSGPPTRDVVETWKRRAPMPLRHAWQEHQGFRRARALNTAISAAQGDYLVFLDGDCLPSEKFASDHRVLAEENYFVQCRRCFVEEDSVADVLAGKKSLAQLALTGKISGLFKSFRLPWPVIRRDQNLNGILGCNLAIWKKDLVAVNGYDESYEGWGKEDSDLAARLYHLGRKRKFVHGRAIVYHLNHPPASRAWVPDALKRLEETIATRRIPARRGLDQHAPGSS
jgi:glycosyltransferase involved in cell wall biosynthesis